MNIPVSKGKVFGVEKCGSDLMSTLVLCGVVLGLGIIFLDVEALVRAALPAEYSDYAAGYVAGLRLAKYLLGGGLLVLAPGWGWAQRALAGESGVAGGGLKFIPRAYAYNFANVRELLWARGRNFLAKEEMQRFREFKAWQSDTGDAGGSAGGESGGRR